jgi:hypothetical protein
MLFISPKEGRHALRNRHFAIAELATGEGAQRQETASPSAVQPRSASFQRLPERRRKLSPKRR